MTSVAPPTGGGYGWSMKDSERLRQRLGKVASRDLPGGFARRDWSKIPHAPDEAFDRKDEEIRQESRARRAEILLRRLPSCYREAALSSSQALSWVNGYLAGQRKSLVILGPTGTGKTYLAAAIARKLLVQHTVPVTYVTVADFLEAMRPGSAEPDMALFSLIPVLILDDLGAEKMTDWGAEQLYKLAHHRSHNGMPVIVTSNLPGAAIKANYEDRTVQRLFGGADLITLSGASRRVLPF
jgi:DNA replication protein DnaC